ncbi:MAG: helix-turn-helix transcriptional regulator [Oscillospiraceae bacterium]
MNLNLLRSEIVKNGMTQEQLAQAIGMSPSTFYRKTKKGIFGTDEVEKIIDTLKIKNPMDIFFN